jgi:hypothetical protein
MVQFHGQGEENTASGKGLLVFEVPPDSFAGVFLTLATGWGFIQSGQISIPPDLAGFVEHCQQKVLFGFEVIVKSPFGDFRRLHDVPLAGERIEVKGGKSGTAT